MKIENEALGIEYELPDDIIQSELERYDDKLFGYLDELENSSNVILASGAICRAAVYIGWLGETTKDDVANMKPYAIKWLAVQVQQFANSFIEKEVDLSEYSIPELLQGTLEQFQQEYEKKRAMLNSPSSLRGVTVRIAAKIGWIDHNPLLVGKLDPSLVNALHAEIQKKIDEAINIPPN